MIRADHQDTQSSHKKTIKYYDIDASASPIEMFDPGNGTRYKDVVIPGFGDCDIALNVWGDSMEPILNSGEIILCKEWTENFIEFGKIYLVITKNNNRMIKYIQPDGNKWALWCYHRKGSLFRFFKLERGNCINR